MSNSKDSMAKTAYATPLDLQEARRPQSSTMQSVRPCAIDIETYAMLRARLAAGHPRGIVLALACVREEEWRHAEDTFAVALMQEARTGNFVLGRRYATVYAEEWSNHAPRFVASVNASMPVTPRGGQGQPVQTPSRPMNGTVAMDARTMSPPAVAKAAPPPLPKNKATVMMAAPSASPGAMRELEHYVRVSASLSVARDRNAALAQHQLTVEMWVQWSTKMSALLSQDPAMRARYSTLLHEAIRSATPPRDHR